MSKLSEERERLTDLLRRQGKEQKARQKKRPGSLRRAQAKRRLQRLKGLIAASKKAIAELVAAKNKRGPGAAVRWAMAQQGTAEHPDGSNWGKPVENWIKRTGYTSPVPWCGCFAHEAVVVHGKAKIPSGIRLGFTGYIEEDARGNRNGLKEVAWENARPGDIVVFHFGHIAVVRSKPTGNSIGTIEGNTSPLSSGSQANGGTVAAKTRARADVSVIARPKKYGA